MKFRFVYINLSDIALNHDEQVGQKEVNIGRKTASMVARCEQVPRISAKNGQAVSSPSNHQDPGDIPKHSLSPFECILAVNCHEHDLNNLHHKKRNP